MNKQKRLDGKFKLVRLTAALEKDMRAFCKIHKVKSESALVREAISAYIYTDNSQAADVYSMEDLYRKIDTLQGSFNRVFRTENTDDANKAMRKGGI